MSAIVFIGDELTAAGFRLTGIETIAPRPDEVAPAFAEATKRAGLVIITAALTGHLPRGELDAAMAAESPAVAIIPDVLFAAPPPDLAQRVRQILGIET